MCTLCPSPSPALQTPHLAGRSEDAPIQAKKASRVLTTSNFVQTLSQFISWPCVEELPRIALQEPPALRLIIAASAAATLLYTPVLKRLTAVKNLSVALVIALTPLTGALSLGQVRCTHSAEHQALLSHHTYAHLCA